MERIESIYYWIYVVIMFSGALTFYILSLRFKNIPKEEYFYAIAITLWSGAAYASMALGQGLVFLGQRITYFARYIDWVVTTPLLLLSLAAVAMYYSKKDYILISQIVFADVLFIVTGLVGDLSSRPLNFFWYAIGMVSFVVLNWVLWTKLRDKAKEQGEKIRKVYDRLLIYLTLFWIGYPLVWILGPSGFGIIDQVTDTLLFVILPVFSKVGFGLFLLLSLKHVPAPSKTES